VATTDAATADLDTVADRHADLAVVNLLPDVHLVDAGYVSVGQVLAAADDHGVELVGPLPPDTSWQAGDEQAFDLTRFAIDYDAHHVVCPHGKVSRNWQPARSRDGLPVIRATFRQPDCRPCPDRSRCTRSEDNARHVTFLPRRQQQTQQRLRAEQATDAWRQRYALRCGVESLIAQASGAATSTKRATAAWPRPTCNTCSPRWRSTSSALTAGSPGSQRPEAGPPDSPG